ncbi:MAG: transposase [Akkermansiaceae bacterium]|nr:transposase [Akkermansiaceae bacterium]
MPPIHCLQPGAPTLTGSAGLDEKFILQTAIRSGFMRRMPRKIDPNAFFAALCKEAIQGSPSYNDLAARIESDSGSSASRQAMARRMTEACHHFLHGLLEQAMASKAVAPPAGSGSSLELRRLYPRIVVSDSTVIKLPLRLFDEFSGVANAHRSVCNARIQAAYDLVAMRFLSFSIDPYSKNDLKSAPELEIKTGDLVLRDRGYLATAEIQRHVDAGADCIYRHKSNIPYLNAATSLPLDLLAYLRQHGRADMQVRLNNASRTPVRLVAAPVNQATADLRRMRAKKEAVGHAPSQAVLALMSWTIFITTIPPEKASFETVLALYGLRWRIEVIFKSWKTHLRFGAIHQVSKVQLRVLLKTRLLLIAVWAHTLYAPWHQRLRHEHGRELSLMKFTGWLKRNPARAAELHACLLNSTPDTGIARVLARYCCYDKRKRQNFQQTYDALTLS